MLPLKETDVSLILFSTHSFCEVQNNVCIVRTEFYSEFGVLNNNDMWKALIKYYIIEWGDKREIM